MTNNSISKIKLSPSILSADFARLGEQVKEVTAAGADYIHVDVMDGRFVPNITIGPVVVAAIRPHTPLPLDVHLMIEAPQNYISQFAKAGANIITVHFEACPDLKAVITGIKALGVKAGVSLKPATPAEALADILPELDMVLVMTVEPGFGGQKFMEDVVPKIARLREMVDKRGLRTEIEVDGGINAETAPKAAKAGAHALVAGAAVFSPNYSVQEGIRKLRASLAG